MKIDFLSYQPDRVATIKQVVFGILSPERIRLMSSAEIFRHNTGNQKSQPGTQSDSRLGIIDRGRICQTCRQDYNDCPGHMGHIELAKPVFHPLYLGNYLKKLLSMVCFNCSRLMINFESEGIEQKVRAIRSKVPKARFNLVKTLVDDQRKKNVDSEKRAICPHCNATAHSKIQPHANFFSKLLLIYEVKTSDKDKDPKKKLERTVNPEIVLAVLQGMTEEDITLAGFDPQLSHPAWMIWTVVPFPPVTMRPPTKLDIGRDADDDLTLKLHDISKTNNNIKIQLQKIAEAGQLGKSSYGEIDFLWEILQFHITTYIDNETNKKTSVHRSGRPLKALVQRIKTKEGRVRWNLMGKRVDDSGRTVATPDNNINIDELGVPKKIAVNLVKPEFVTPFNIERLQQYVYNGMEVYPGAKYVVPKGTRFKKPLKVMSRERRQDLKLQYGDVVFRNLLDGDWVLVNRHPSLHRMSMMAHKIVILKGETFRMNVQAVTPYNADFDGDEINLHVPQSLEAENEMARLSHLATQIVSPKNAVPVMGLVQDGLLGLYLFNQFGNLSVKDAMKMASDLGIDVSLKYELTEKSGFQLESRQILNATLPKITVVNSKNIAKDPVQYGRIQPDASINTGSLKAGKSGLFHITWNDYGPEVARRLFDNLARIATNWLLISGFSVGILDCIPNDYIKNRIVNVIKVYDLATQYLVDFQQLRSVPDLNLNLANVNGNLKKSRFSINLVRLLDNIKAEGYTYNNKSTIEQSLGEVYYEFLVNRLLFEFYRLEVHKGSFPVEHQERMFNENAEFVLEFYLHAEEANTFQERLGRLEMLPETTKRFEKVRELASLAKKQNYFKNRQQIVTDLQALRDVDLLGGQLMQEELVMQLEGTGAFIMTMLYIVPGARDMSERLEEKLYELTQGSTTIVNNIISSNVGFYEYRGLGKEQFKYLGNGFQTMQKAKSKGDITNIGQIAGLLGQQDLEGKRTGNFFYRRSLPHFPKDSIEPKYRGYVQNSFLEGLTMLEYFSHAQAGRLNQIDKSIKSVTPETEIVVLENGQIRQITIGEWVDTKLAQSPDEVMHQVEQEMEILKLGDGTFIPTCDEDGNVSWGQITAITRHDPGKQLYRIKTSGGRSVVVTESKSLLIYNHRLKKFLHTSTPDVVVGDYVPVTQTLVESPISLNEIEVTKYFKQGEFITGSMPDKFVLNYQNGLFLGLFLAEGNADIKSGYVQITNSNQEIIDFTTQWFNSMSIANKEQSKQNKLGYMTRDVRGYSTFLAKFLISLIGHGAANKMVPDESLVAPDEFIKGLLSGYISGDGTITESSIVVGSASRRLIDGINMLCSRLGIFGKVTYTVIKRGNLETETPLPLYSLAIRAQWANVFKENIKLIDSGKAEKLAKLKPESVHYRFPTQNDVVLDKITEIELVDVKEYPKVYDLTIPSTLNFGLANGLHVVDTAETGYLQRRLIKMLEPLTNGYDGAIRNSGRNVIQKLYGGDAINPQHIEQIPIELGMIKERFSLTDSDYDKLLTILTPEARHTVQEIPNYLGFANAQSDLIEKLTKDVVELYKSTDLDFSKIGKETVKIYSALPVNFERLVHNNYYRFELGEKKQATSLHPVSILSRLNELTDRVTKGLVLNGANHTLFFRLALHQYLNAKTLMFDYHFTEEAFTVLLEDIYLKYCRSLMSPGESIGIVSAQSIGEPLTQMTLNKFHAAGVGKARSKLQGGVPRLSELLGLTKKDKMKTPSMSMEVSEYYLESQKAINPNLNVDMNLVNMMKSFYFRNLVSTSEIVYDPNLQRPGSELPQPWSINEVDSVLRPGEMPWLIHFQLKPKVKRELRSDTLKNLLETHITTKYNSSKYNSSKSKQGSMSDAKFQVLVSYDGLTKPDNETLESFVHIRVKSDLFGSSSSGNILGHLVDLKNELLTLNIKGQKDINEVFVERESGRKYIFTIGSNLQAIIENPVYRTVVELKKVTSNDILEIEQLYGIEAARYAFINEMYTTFESYLNVRHLELLADNMSHLGELLRVNRFGVKRGNNEPLHRASFEETTKQFVDSSAHTEIDPMTGPSANIMFGQLINSGTNSFRVMLDIEKLKTLEPVEQQRKVVLIDPFNRRGVERIEIPNTSHPNIESLNISDLFIFRFTYVPIN